MLKIIKIIIGVLVLFLVLLSLFTFQVHEGTSATVTRLGTPVRVITDCGLHTRLPWPIESVYRFDARKHIMETSFTETLTSDKRNVILLNNVVWQIEDPLKFLRAVGDRDSAEIRLDGMVTNAKNAVLGRYELTALISTDEDNLMVDEIEEEIFNMVEPAAGDQLGITVESVGILRVALPQDNITQVFEQMRAERQQYAAQYRAEGQQAAAAIISQSDLEKAQILAEAEQRAEEIRADADAEAARIYADAHSRDPEFYLFLRSLQTLEEVLGVNSTLILDTDAMPFSMLESSETED